MLNSLFGWMRRRAAVDHNAELDTLQGIMADELVKGLQSNIQEVVAKMDPNEAGMTNKLTTIDAANILSNGECRAASEGENEGRGRGSYVEHWGVGS
jgi:hypothetical protein